MDFSINHPILFVIVGIIVAIVLAQSVFFLIKAWKHGREIGMDQKKLKKIATTAAVFTVAPAVAIVISKQIHGIGVRVLQLDLGKFNFRRNGRKHLHFEYTAV